MTKQEAIEAIRQGKAISHTSFICNEYIQLIHGRLTSADNVQMNWDAFWRIRTGGHWEVGWVVTPLPAFNKENNVRRAQNNIETVRSFSRTKNTY